MGEEHDSEGGADGSGREVGGKASEYSSTVSVASGNASPDGLDIGRGTLNLFSALPEWVL